MHISGKKKIFTLFFAVLLLLSASVTAYANEAVDFSESGTISIAMTYNETAVSGGSLTLYRAGAVTEDNGNYSFALTADFEESGVSLNSEDFSESAAALAEYVSRNSIESIAQQDIADDGTAVFSDLELGLYLIIQNEAADGYQAVSPFLVSVPMHENGAYVYTVDASPKVELQTEKENDSDVLSDSTQKNTVSDSDNNSSSSGSGTNGSSSGSGGSSSSSGSKDSTLPYTGQLNWPVSVLAVSGLFLFLAGWALRSGKKELSHEA